MKRWGSALFPLSILLVLAALTFWLRTTSELPDASREGRYRHDPDYIINDAQLNRFGPDGRQLYTVKAVEMRHYPDDDSSELIRPDVVYTAPQKPRMTMTADFGNLSEGGKIVDLSGNVRIERAASGKDEALTATTSQLTVLPEEEMAFTRAAVRITQGKSWVTGIGLRIDQRAQTFVLESQARAVLESRSSKKR